MKRIIMTVLCMMLFATACTVYAEENAEKSKVYDFTAAYSEEETDMLGVGVKDGFHVSVIKGKLSPISSFGIPLTFTLYDEAVNDYDYAVFMLKCGYVDEKSVIEVKFIKEDGIDSKTINVIPDNQFNLYSIKLPDEKIKGIEIFVNSVEPNMDMYAVDLDYIRLYKSETPVLLTIDSVSAISGTERVTLDSPALIRDNFTLTPARFVAESVGADVQWVAQERKVIITKGDTIIELIIDNKLAKVNGQEVELDASPCIINDFTYTPARFVAETLGCTVEWEPEHKTVIIS